jgi:hypothetical protein
MNQPEFEKPPVYQFTDPSMEMITQQLQKLNIAHKEKQERLFIDLWEWFTLRSIELAYNQGIYYLAPQYRWGGRNVRGR